jgi:hypothetical protein
VKFGAGERLFGGIQIDLQAGGQQGRLALDHPLHLRRAELADVPLNQVLPERDVGDSARIGNDRMFHQDEVGGIGKKKLRHDGRSFVS